ncbi:MAG: histidine kinase, partial [Bdellovibrio sp. CG10_big_fil_rev_8_21_14_0_10_47_8]
QEKRVSYCNEPASLLCDLSVRKIVRSQPFFDQLFRFSTPVEALQSLSEIHDPTPYQEVSFQIESGKTGKVQLTLQPFPEIDGKKRWLVFFRDVTLEETLQKKYRAELEQKEDVIKDLQVAQAELEKYSKNLEKMVDERTAEIQTLNRTMTALLDSLHQGFFIFGKEGDCLDVFSKACLTTIENNPAQKKIWSVLGLSEKQVPGFKNWMTTLFSEMLPFEDLAPLGPAKYAHSQGLHIQLEYYPLRSNQGQIEGVVVVATDISSLVQAQLDAEKERAHAKMIVTLVQNKRQVQGFLQESEALLQELNQELSRGLNADQKSLFRCLHTLKGGASIFSIQSMVQQAHESEGLLSEWKTQPSTEHFDRLKQSSLKIQDYFQKFIQDNEPILGSQQKRDSRWVELDSRQLNQFYPRLPETLQLDFLQQFLMEPVGEYFNQYQEVVQSIAEQEMKSVLPIQLRNGSLPVLPEPYSQLFSTLIHAFRNAVDHGIESPDRRMELQKNPAGQITVSFEKSQTPEGPWLLIEIQDDGGGIDPAKIRKKFADRGQSLDQESDQQVIQHIFDSQFSTKEVLTETSGRGVGMDAILFSAQQIGGTAWVESKVGVGTQLKIKVPYLIHWPETAKKAA